MKMLYDYILKLNWIFTLFGLKKPFISSSIGPCTISLRNKFWSLNVIVCATISLIVSVTSTIETNSRKNLENISKINDLITNVLIIIINSVNGEKVCVQLYETVNVVLRDMKFSERSLKLISVKFCLWILIPMVIFMNFIVLEMIYVDPPFYSLLIRMPTLLSFLHLILHLYLLLAILKVLNLKMSQMLTFDPIQESQQKSTLLYLFDPDISFIEVDQNVHFNLKFLCRIYDDISTCVKLLEHHHSFQVLLTIWLTFSGSVIGVTLVVCKEVKFVWLVAARTVLPFLWCFIGCYIDDQLRKQVETTETLIVKYLIDFRCDQPRRNVLQTFKQLVSTSRLQFTAHDLFNLNYAMILGMLMNVITYSIILVQLFLSEQDTLL